MTKLAVVGFGLLLTLFGTGCHCCQPVCDAYGDLIDEFGQLSPISKPWCHEDECSTRTCAPVEDCRDCRE
jgi:hypothetical protein